MKQTRRKGNSNEERVCWFFKQNGYEVWTPNWSRWGSTGRFSSSDIFGVFDVIATSKNELVMVQVKTGSGFLKKVEAEIVALPMPVNVRREYWVFKPNGSVDARMYYSNGEYKQFSINFEDMKYETAQV